MFIFISSILFFIVHVLELQWFVFRSEFFFYSSYHCLKEMARGHQKELARARNEKGGAGGKPTTQKGTAGRKIPLFHGIFSIA